MIITGTAHFVDLLAAVTYYKPYGFTADDVRRKLREGEIHLGAPSLRPGERLLLIDGNTRYAVESVDSAEKVGKP